MHEPKALQPMVVRPVGSDTLCSDVQEWKHMAGTKSICAWISTYSLSPHSNLVILVDQFNR